ncbi:MAG: FMN-binding negative transcriptional regulator [Phenylobacterium sp.]|nr:FMN-binding negative transcriptional regulator [Phenylobacterium sp.]
MADPGLFAPRDDSDVEALIAAAPLAWVVSATGGPPLATPLPLLIAHGWAGRAPPRLIGHFARTNPQVERLRREPQALLLFMGPNAYVSPSWMADRRQAPTWNYACAQLHATIRFQDAPGDAEAAVTRLANLMEQGRPGAWSPAEMAERLARLARGVVAFEAEVSGTTAKFKLGQDERRDVFADIVAGLSQSGHAELALWMQSFAMTASDGPTNPSLAKKV